MRLKLDKGKGGEEILPALWQDNYISLPPGETRKSPLRIAPAASMATPAVEYQVGRGIYFPENCHPEQSEEWQLKGLFYSSAGISKFTRAPRKPRVFHAPNTMPAAIQMEPAIFAGLLRLSQSKSRLQIRGQAAPQTIPSIFSRAGQTDKRGCVHSHERD